jgi:gas vesicle protein
MKNLLILIIAILAGVLLWLKSPNGAQTAESKTAPSIQDSIKNIGDQSKKSLSNLKDSAKQSMNQVTSKASDTMNQVKQPAQAPTSQTNQQPVPAKS